MKDYKRIAFGGIAAVSLVAAGATPALAAVPGVGEDADAVASTRAIESDASGIVKADASQGTFAWDQTSITPNAVIASMFRVATASLCNATDDFAVVNPLAWEMKVSGDVENEFVETVDEMAANESVKQQMTCSCGSNPADGAAIITAEVKGIPVSYLVQKANPVAGANTITFISSDGTEQAIPLGYVIGRHAVISYEINGEDLSASVGGNNQLWMTRTAASYFTRDIVEVRITKEATAPANPGDGIDYPNSPNAGISGANTL